MLIPALRLVPSLYAWRVKSRIYRWYGALIAIERSALSETSAEERQSLIERLDAIEESVNGLKMPLAYADQFYVLREHIGFVRDAAHAGARPSRHDMARSARCAERSGRPPASRPLHRRRTASTAARHRVQRGAFQRTLKTIRNCSEARSA